VDPSATVVVMGPKQLAEQFTVDEIALADVQQRAMLKRVEEAARYVTLANAKDFSLKFETLISL
jgi:copper(I)-binding protein